MNLTKNELEQKVNQIARDIGKISLGDLLAGGVVSEVYGAKLTDKNDNSQNIVVKYTRSDIPRSSIFSRTDIDNSFSKAAATHNLDIKLQKELNLPSPNIIKHYPDNNITLMTNFNDDGYILLQDRILKNTLSSNTFVYLGKMLANVRTRLEKIGGTFSAVEDTRQQFDERFYELKTLLYNGRMEIFNQIEDDFVEKGAGHLVWTDGDQKNFAVTEGGEALLFDTGRSVPCDPDFMLPNLLGHLGLFYIAGYLDEDLTSFNTCIDSYLTELQKIKETFNLNEEKFVNYFVAGVLHRGLAMRWIDSRISSKVGADSIKNACMHLGDIVFDKENRITEIPDLFDVMQKIRKLASQGKYKRPQID
jgi:hypothetical protein